MSAEGQRRFLAEVKELWPVALGVVAQVRKPCIRRQCRACAEGRKHPAVIFTFMEKGRRRCMYVPQGLAPILRQAIQNGRRLEQRLRQMGAELIRQYRRERDELKPKGR